MEIRVPLGHADAKYQISMNQFQDSEQYSWGCVSRAVKVLKVIMISPKLHASLGVAPGKLMLRTFGSGHPCSLLDCPGVLLDAVTLLFKGMLNGVDPSLTPSMIVSMTASI